MKYLFFLITAIFSFSVEAEQFTISPLSSSSEGVTSFNSRVGAVVPATGDYAAFYVPYTGASSSPNLGANGITGTNWGILANGHFESLSSAPGVATCGTGSPSVSGTDTKGVITTGTAATACTLNFATSYATTPVCTITTNSTTVIGGITSISTSALIIGLGTGLTAGNVYYICIQ